MARIKYDIAQAFARKEAKHDASAFRSTGDAIYSYGMRLAHWEGERVVYNYPERAKGGYKAPSVTTSAHMLALEAVVERRPA